MKIFTSEAVRAIDNFTIENEPVVSIDLMERAASALTSWFVRRFKTNQQIIVFAGPGNNGGDALAMARLLADRQYTVKCYLITDGKNLSANCQVNMDRLKEQGLVDMKNIANLHDFPELKNDQLVIDGIFGSGLTRQVDGKFAEAIRLINKSKTTIVSIDIPSGLFGEDNTENSPDCIIQADYTSTFQFPFLSFFFRENAMYTGEWKVLDIKLNKDIVANTKTDYSIINNRDVCSLVPVRERFSHKGTFGHALVIAGKYGMMGAALLTGKSALRGGAGLVTIHIPKSGYEIVQTAIPEAIVSIDQSEILFSKPPDLSKFNAVAIGPGLGTKPNCRRGLTELLENCKVAMVLDADALNLIAEDQEMLKMLPENTILTPHPTEFDRLAGKSPDAYSRHIRQKAFSKRYKVIVVLKGAYTGISFPDGTYKFNVNGNPGMATGGSGDVLTGIIVSLLARGLKPGSAAIAGVFLHGLAGDLAAGKMDQEAMNAGDIIDQMGEAFKVLKALPFLHEGRVGGVGH